MNRRIVIAICMLAAIGWIGTGSAMAEETLKNQVTAYVTHGSTERELVIGLWAENANPIIGATLPFKFGLDQDSLFFDSLTVVGGAAEGWAVMQPVYDVKLKTLLVNTLRGIDPKKFAPAIPPGKSPIMWIYLRAKEKISLKKLQIVNVTLPPQNDLMFVTASMNKVNPAFTFSREKPPGLRGGKGAGKDSESKSK